MSSGYLNGSIGFWLPNAVFGSMTTCTVPVTPGGCRQNMHRRLDDLVMRTTHLESDMSSTKHKLDRMEKVTVQVTTLRTKAQGAGTLGRWLIRLGIGIVTLAGWLIGAYTWMTGRPPP